MQKGKFDWNLPFVFITGNDLSIDFRKVEHKVPRTII